MKPHSAISAQHREVTAKSVAAFFAVLLLMFWSVTHLDLRSDGRLQVTSPRVIDGDEPHYLLVLNSILFDHDLELQDDYLRAQHGLDAGGVPLFAHHSIIVNRKTGRHGIWFQHRWDRDLGPGPDVYEVSSHPVAYPLLLAALLAPFHPKMSEVQGEASVVMVIICWLGAVFTYLLARKVGMDRGYALFATAVLAFASPWLAYTRSYYSEPPIGLFTTIALYALEAGNPIFAATAAAIAGIFKPPFFLIGGGFAIALLLEKRWRDVSVTVVTVGLFAVALMTFNYWLSRTPIISGNGTGPWPFGSDTARDFRVLEDTLIGSSHGLFTWTPWTILALVSIGSAFWSGSTSTRLLREMFFPIVLYLALLGASNFGPGACYGPRYWVPFLPWMAVAAIDRFRLAGATWRLIFVVLLIAGAPISIVGALRYPQMFSRPPWLLLPWK